MNKYVTIPVNPYFQIAFIVFNLACMIGFAIVFRQTFYSSEYWPKKVETTVTTMHNVDVPICKLIIKIKDVISANLKDGGAICNAKFSLEVNKKDANKIDPKAILDNLIFHSGKIIDKKIYPSKVLESKVIYNIYLLLDVHNMLNYETYPFDDHVIQFKFEVPTKHLPFNVETEFVADSSLDFAGWNPVKTTSVSSQSEQTQTKTLEFFLGLNKNGDRIALSILLPMCIIFFVNLFSLSIDPEKGRTLIVTSLLALNSFRIVLENSLPRTSYLLALDKFYIVFLLASLLIFIIHILQVEMSRKITYLIVALCHCVVIGTFVEILYPWLLVSI